MLRASSDNHEQSVNLKAIMDGGALGGIEHANELSAFAEAIVSRDAQIITSTRMALIEVAGVDVMVDAAGVASNFERMVRIADSTGIELGPMDTATEDLRGSLNINQFKERG